MPKEFIMRGNTSSGTSQRLPFSGGDRTYAYQLIEFQLYPSSDIGTDPAELAGIITCGNVALDPVSPNFSNEAVIATTTNILAHDHPRITSDTVINDLFPITQDLILSVIDKSATAQNVNWQCRFREVKLSGPAEAAANFNQFTIFDGQ